MPPADRPSSSSRAATAGIFAAYVAIAIALTWPLLPKMATGVPNDLGDPLLNTWILWWNAVKVPLTDAWWNAPAYYPTEGVLTFSEHLLGLSPISTPIYWLTGNIQLGYNVALFVSFPLSAFFGYLLCKDLTGRRDAAFIGGLIFGFTPYRIVQLPHIQVLCSYWMPVALLGLHRYLRDRRVKWLVLFGAGWFMQALCNGYYMVFLSVLIGCWLLWFVPWREWRLWRNVAIAWGLAALPIVPIVAKYREVHTFLGLHRSITEIMLYSADMTSLLDHTNRLLFWRFLPAFHRAEGELFPGVAGVLLVAAGIWISRAKASPGLQASSPRMRRVRIILAGTAILAGAVTVSAVVAPWEWHIGPVSLSATHLHKPLTWTLVITLGLVLTSPRVRRAFRGRSILGFYVLAAGLMWLFSFGPKPTFMGVQALYGGPYSWLVKLPGVDTLRVPARFHMAAVLCLSVAAAVCFARLVARFPKRSQIAFTFAVALVAMADTWIWGFPVEPAPKPWAIQQQESPGPVLELPLGDFSNDIDAMYRSMWTGNPVVNGYSGYGPSWYGPVTIGLRRHNTAVLQELSARGVRQIVLDTATDTDQSWRHYLDSHPDISFVGSDGTHRLYRMAAAPAQTERPFGGPVKISSITASLYQDRVAAMTDDDLTTRWSTGPDPQLGGETLTIDLGAPTRVAAVETALGPFGMDAPRDLIIEVSDDGRAWTEVWRGDGGLRLAFSAAFADPVRVPVRFDVGDRTSRFIRLRQVGADDFFYWSVAELHVLAPAGR